MDGVDLRQAHPQWWRTRVAYLPQEPTFFDGTIEENLLQLNPDTSADQLTRLLERVGLQRFIDEHPQGLRQPLTQGGRNLSLGIRRRLALVRALTAPARLAVLDEPAEGLDQEGHQYVAGVMNTLVSQGVTLIILTTNPSTFHVHSDLLDLNVKPVPRLTPRVPEPVP